MLLNFINLAYLEPACYEAGSNVYIIPKISFFTVLFTMSRVFTVENNRRLLKVWKNGKISVQTKI